MSSKPKFTFDLEGCCMGALIHLFLGILFRLSFLFLPILMGLIFVFLQML